MTKLILIEFGFLLILASINFSSAIVASECPFNSECFCTEERPDILSQVICENVKEFPKFALIDRKITVRKFHIKGKISKMPQAGLDKFKHIDQLIIERENDKDQYDTENDGYTLTNCSIDELTLIGFYSPLPIEATRIDPNTLSKLRALVIERSSTQLVGTPFATTPSLEKLGLRNDGLIDGSFIISNHPFQSIALKLIEFDLSNNKLKSYRGKVKDAINDLTNLQVLRLGGNEFKNLDGVDFSIFPKLKILDLSGNKELDKFDTSLFSGNHTYLKEIHLNNCKLIEIPDVLQLSPDLTILSLAGNQITNLSRDQFNGSVLLQSLILDGNPIDYVELGIFKELTSIKNFDMIGWNLTNIDLTIFESGNQETGHLENLRIKNNTKLQVIKVSDVKRVQKSLRKIEIGGNNISEIDKSIHDLLIQNPALTVTISDESNINCENDQIIPMSKSDQNQNGTNMTETITSTSSPQTASLLWLAELAICEKRITIESNVFCARNGFSNDTKSLIDFLQSLKPPCAITNPPATAYNVPQTTAGHGAKGASGTMSVLTVNTGSWMMTILGVWVLLANRQ